MLLRAKWLPLVGGACITLALHATDPAHAQSTAEQGCAAALDAAKRLGSEWDHSLERQPYAANLKQAFVSADQAQMDNLLRERGFDKGLTVAIVFRGLVLTNGQITISIRGWKGAHANELLAESTFDVRALFTPEETALLTAERARSHYNFTGLAKRDVYDGTSLFENTFLFEDLTAARRLFVLGNTYGGANPHHLRVASLNAYGISTIASPATDLGMVTPDFNENFIELDEPRLQAEQKAKIGTTTLLLIDATLRPLKYSLPATPCGR